MVWSKCLSGNSSILSLIYTFFHPHIWPFSHPLAYTSYFPSSLLKFSLAGLTLACSESSHSLALVPPYQQRPEAMAKNPTLATRESIDSIWCHGFLSCLPNRKLAAVCWHPTKLLPSGTPNLVLWKRKVAYCSMWVEAVGLKSQDTTQSEGETWCSCSEADHRYIPGLLGNTTEDTGTRHGDHGAEMVPEMQTSHTG